ncbi:MAG: OmpA family protein [Acidobacteriota bacterium]
MNFDSGDEAPQGAPEWVVTFGDMMSLLMVFFVLLLSFSTMEIEKFKQVAGAVREAFGVQKEKSWTGVPSGETLLSTSQNPTSGEVSKVADDKDKVVMFERISQWIRRTKRQNQLEATLEDRGVVLRAKGSALFDSGSAKLRSDALSMVDEIARLSLSSGGNLEVEGHTDSRPISTPAYPSNWELSSARAGAVVRRMVETAHIPAGHLKAIGFAETRPLADNSTPEGRARNRRVEFLFLNEE